VPQRLLLTPPLALSLAFVLAGCTSVSVPTPVPATAPPLTHAPTLTPSPNPEVVGSYGGWAFKMPSAWNVVWPQIWTMPVGPGLFLSDAAIADPCPTQPEPTGCWLPLTELPANGILVTFSGSAVLTLANQSPVPMVRKAGQPCLDIGGDEEIATLLRGFGVSACLRGPNLASNETAFRRLLSTMIHP